jgi:hypothetical protein
MEDFETLSNNSKAATKSGVDNAKISPEIETAFSQDPAFLNEKVVLTVSTIAPCGKIAVERAVDINGKYTTAEAAVNWVKYDIQKDIVAGQPVTYDFTPDALGIFGFRAHYISAGCKGYSNEFLLTNITVIKRCTGLSLDAKLVGSNHLGDGLYRFTVEYKVNTCGETYTMGKLQGGLTAIASLQSTIPVNPTIKNTNKNTVITFREDAVKGEKVYTVIFEKKLTGLAPFELTGDWSFEGTDAAGMVSKVGYNNKIVFTP